MAVQQAQRPPAEPSLAPHGARVAEQAEGRHVTVVPAGVPRRGAFLCTDVRAEAEVTRTLLLDALLSFTFAPVHSALNRIQVRA